MRVPARLKLLALASVALFVATNLPSLLELQRAREGAPRAIEVLAEAPPATASPARGGRPGVALAGRRAP